MVSGRILKQARIYAELNQAELGARIWPDMGRNAAQCKIGRIERAESVNKKTVELFAAALNLKVSELIQNNKDETKSQSSKIKTDSVQISAELKSLIPSITNRIEALNSLAMASPGDANVLFSVLYAWLLELKSKWQIEIDLPSSLPFPTEPTTRKRKSNRL